MIILQTIDESFIREEKKFKSLESAVRIMVRDISSYVEHVQVSSVIAKHHILSGTLHYNIVIITSICIFSFKNNIVDSFFIVVLATFSPFADCFRKMSSEIYHCPVGDI